MERVIQIILIVILLEILGSFLIQKKVNIQSPIENITPTLILIPTEKIDETKNEPLIVEQEKITKPIV